MELQCFHDKSSFIISMFTYFMVHPCSRVHAVWNTLVGLFYVSRETKRHKFYTMLAFGFNLGLWLYLDHVQSKTFARINLFLTYWVGVVNPAFWLIKIGLIFCTLIMQKKTFEIKIFFIQIVHFWSFSTIL